MKKFSKLLAVVVAIAVVVCPMMSIVSNATSTGGYKIEALDANNLKLTISSTDGFIAYSASVGFNSASAFQSTYSSDGYTNGLKLIDYTTKTAAKSSYNTPQISANATGSALNVVVMPSDINNLDLLTEVVIGLRVASGTTASLTKIQAADDGADVTEDPTLLSFPAADANTGAIDSTDPAYISSNATTNAHTHSFTQQTQTAAYLRTAATCSANATYWYSCATCGLASSTNYFTATGTMLAHTPDNTETYVKAAATCTADAQYWQECSVCHQQLSTYWTKPSTASGHSMTYHEATASTCVYQGNDAYYSCSRCGKLFGDNAGANEVTIEGVTRALGDHTASNTKKFLKTAAGCTTDAVYYQECSVCGTQLVTTWTDTGSATGHTPAAAVTENTVAATCSATGSYDSVVYCSVCGAEISRTPNVIAKLAHTVVEDAAVPATCTETGLTAGSHCSVCGETIVAQTVVPATGHTAVEDAAVPATCTETGLTAGSHCSVCGETIVAQTVVPATGHTVVEDAAVAATCTATGLTAGSHCSVCGETIVAQTVVPALGHNFTYNSNSNGTHAVGCTRCDYAATEDCDTAGAEGACSKCGYKAAVACTHVVGEVIASTPATELSPGSLTYICSECGAEVTVDVAWCRFARTNDVGLIADSEVLITFSARVNDLVRIMSNGANSSGTWDNIIVRYDAIDAIDDGFGAVVRYADLSKAEVTTVNAREVRKFSYGVASMFMANDVTATTFVYCAANDTWYSGTQSVKSVRSLATQMMSTDPKLFTDLLNYGAAAQINFNYDVENLANEGIDQTNATPGVVEVVDQKVLATSSTAEYPATFASFGAVADSKILMNVEFQFGNKYYADYVSQYGGLKVVASFTDFAGNEVTRTFKNVSDFPEDPYTFEQIEGNVRRFKFQITELSAADLRQEVTFNLYTADDTKLTIDSVYSIQSYVYSQRTSSSDENLLNTLNALMKYSDSAKAFLLSA